MYDKYLRLNKIQNKWKKGKLAIVWRYTERNTSKESSKIGKQ